MEGTQSDVTDFINFEQFKTIVWERGLPQFIVDFLIYITGWPTEVEQIINTAAPIYHKVANQDLDKYKMTSLNPLDQID